MYSTYTSHTDDNEAARNHNGTTQKYNTCYEDPGKQILILYGTEYGFSEELAHKLFDRFRLEECSNAGIQPRVLNSKHYKLIDYEREQVILHIFSTTGDGEVVCVCVCVCVCVYVPSCMYVDSCSCACVRVFVCMCFNTDTNSKVL